jgi:gas vesicle protein
MSRRNNTTAKRLALGSFAAALVGYVAGILSAPKSGRQTREDIKDASDKGKQQAEEEFNQLSDHLNDVLKEARKNGEELNVKAQKELKERVNKALDNKEKVKEIAKAVHKGNASDHDLKIALKDASNAVDHLKEYLKK